jgi:prevent-host-death family protein
MLARRQDFRGALDHIISVSDLGRGKASKVIQSVESSKEQFIVVKNNKPQAIIMSVDEYNELLEYKEELELLLLATKRLKENEESEYSTFEEVMKEFDITEEELDELEDSVEIE